MAIPIIKVSNDNCISGNATTGCCGKWRIRNKDKFIWIKVGMQNFGTFEHECVAEVIASSLAIELGFKNVCRYYPCVVEFNTGIRTIGCYSYEFNSSEEKVVSIYDIQKAGKIDKNYFLKKGYDKFLVDIKDYTGLDMRKGLNSTLLIDSLVLNSDRNMWNICLLYNRNTKSFREAPMFDFGCSLGTVFAAYVNSEGEYNDDFEICNYKSEPFTNIHNEQMEYTAGLGIEDALRSLQTKEMVYTMKVIDSLYIEFGLENGNKYDVENPIFNIERLYFKNLIKGRITSVLKALHMQA